jgi:hypothetical protein
MASINASFAEAFSCRAAGCNRTLLVEAGPDKCQRAREAIRDLRVDALEHLDRGAPLPAVNQRRGLGTFVRKTSSSGPLFLLYDRMTR